MARRTRNTRRDNSSIPESWHDTLDEMIAADTNRNPRDALHHRHINGDPWAAWEALALHLHQQYDQPLPLWVVEELAQPLAHFLISNGRLGEHDLLGSSIFMAGSLLSDTSNKPSKEPRALSLEEHAGLRPVRRGQPDVGHNTIFRQAYTLQKQARKLTNKQALLDALSQLHLAQHVEHRQGEPYAYKPPSSVPGGQVKRITITSMIRRFQDFKQQKKVAEKMAKRIVTSR